MEKIDSTTKGGVTNSIYYDSNTKVIYVVYIGVVDEDISKEMYRKIVVFSESNTVNAVLVNAIQLKGTFTRLTDFFKNEIFPAFEKNGIQIVSLALTTDVFSRFAINQLLKLLNTKISFKVFPTLKESVSYLNDNLNSVTVIP